MVRVGDTVSTENGDSIVKLITRVFQANKTVTEHGLIAYSGVCFGMGERLNVNEFG